MSTGNITTFIPFYIKCPHCSDFIYIEELNCSIFRHGVMKNNMHIKINKLSKQINIIEDETEQSDVSNISDVSEVSDILEKIINPIPIINNSKNLKETDNSINKIENLIDSLTTSIIEMENKKEETVNDELSVKSEKGISKNMLDSITFNSDNKYEEIDETSEPIDNNINDLRISSMSDGTREKSYNSKSVINNGKIYFNS